MTGSAVYAGKVIHERLETVRHRFRYNVIFYRFRLAELESLSGEVRGFSANSFNIVSFKEKDYLLESGNIENDIRQLLEMKGITAAPVDVQVITAARYLNYVFNPVSFFYCYDSNSSLFAIIAEVNNTFNERHVYVLPVEKGVLKNGLLSFTETKAFHVSPFFDMNGEYHFFFNQDHTETDIRIILKRDKKTSIVTRLTGKPMPFNSRNLLIMLLRFPLTAWMTFPRILWQAGRLYFQRKLSVYSKPDPDSPMTIKSAPPGFFDRMYKNLAFSFFRKFRKGKLAVRLPDKKTYYFGDSDNVSAELICKNYSVFRKMVFGADVGFGESYTDGDWTSDDLSALLGFFAENLKYVNDSKSVSSKVSRLVNRFYHFLNKNSKSGSRKNIQAHYDLSNDFFSLFLDESMMYSAGVFPESDSTLNEAQKEKNRRIIRKAGLNSHHHVLEIGTGWGGFAIQAVRETGCRVTSITLSEEQMKWALEKIRQEGLEDRIEVKLIDYRDMTGQFDRIVSIEMLEAVGHEYYGTFMASVDSLLKPGGRAVIQVISIPDQRYEEYRKNPDWIQKYIFPGGMLPSLTVLSSAMTEYSQLFVDHLENIGPHYAETLRRWRSNFESEKEQIIAQGFDSYFIRMWRYYLAYCEAGFEKRVINNLQLVLKRAGE